MGLFEQYQSLFANYTAATLPPPWSEHHKLRKESFTKALSRRPEKRFVIVSHFYFMKHMDTLGLGCMGMGETVARTSLDRTGRWQMLSESTCNGRRRRWAYGNYQRQRDAQQEP